MKFSLIFFIGVVVIIGWMIGYYNIPGEWYVGLVKPAFNPPSWIFGPIWTLLYVLIGIAGWRTWHKEGVKRAFLIWLSQMFLNFMWSPAFFSFHRMDISLGILLMLLVSILVFIALRWRDDRLSAYFFIPYCAWVCFAGVLNLSLMLLN